MNKPSLSALISAHNEESQLADCLDTLTFSDEVVVLLDRCTDRSQLIAEKYTRKIFVGDWAIEGDRRNQGISLCEGDWILEVDADERVSEKLANEIRRVVDTSTFDWHEIPVDNFIGTRLVRYGWGASYGKAAYPGLFRNGVKKWGRQRVHPKLSWVGRKGPMLNNRILHFVDKDISDMIKRLDSYTTARAIDIRESGEMGSYLSNIRRIFSRFLKCYFFRKGYKEGGLGILIAIFAGLYPIISYIKARNEDKLK